MDRESLIPKWKSEKKEKKSRYSHKEKSKGKSEVKDAKQTVVYMIVSDEEGAVSIPYQIWAEPIKSFIKQRGAVWCPIFKVWRTSKVQLEYIKRDLPSILTAHFQEPPKFVMLAIQPTSDYLSVQGHKYKKLESNLKDYELFDRLYPFQRQTLNLCLERHGRILIADEMGIGKSVQSLACSLLFTEGFPLLIISPSALKHVWKDQVLKWYQNIVSSAQIIILKKGALKPGQLSQAKVVIVSYEIASKLTENLQGFQTVICDEAHYLKNPDTNRCSQLVPFLMAKKRIFLLTGTPALAKPKQLFNLLRILRPDIFTKLQEFGQRYCQRRHNPWTHKMQYDGAKNLAELHYLLKKTVMIRRLKADVLSQLPSKQRQIIYMQTQKSVVAQIKDTLKDRLSISSIRQSQKLIDHFGRDESGESPSIMRCYMLSAMAKLQSVKDYIGAILENDIKVIIFAHHKLVMDQLENHLKSLKYQYIRLDGEVSPETRKKKVDQFQEDSSIKVALLSVTAMGTGFTLTAASTVIFAELHWTPAILIQAEDRSHRIGQKNAVNIHYLIGDNTLDPIMLRQLEKKIGTVTKVLDGQAETMNIEVIPKGQMGAFQIHSQQMVQSKNKKITDYFGPKKQKQAQSKKPQMRKVKVCQTQSMQDQSEEDPPQNLQNDILQKEESDSLSILQFLRSKRKGTASKHNFINLDG